MKLREAGTPKLDIYMNNTPCLHSQYVIFLHDDLLLHILEVGTVILFVKQIPWPDFKWPYNE